MKLRHCIVSLFPLLSLFSLRQCIHVNGSTTSSYLLIRDNYHHHHLIPSPDHHPHHDYHHQSAANSTSEHNDSFNTDGIRRAKRSYSSERHIEIMVVADSKMAKYHGDNLRHYILTLMATVALIYRDASIGNAISIAIVKLTVMDEDESRELIYSSASKTLRHFCRWQHMHNHADDTHPYHHDTAILLTRVDLCRMPKSCDTLGLAQSGQICDPSASCAVIEDNGLSTAFTIAHELGHVLGIPHDDSTKCMRFHEKGQRHYIMARMIDYNSHPWSWSSCSRHYITEFLDGGNGECLLDKPSENLLSDAIARTNDGISVLSKMRLPGEIFDIDYQCELVYGPSSKICPYMPVCKRLWCTISIDGGGCRTQHMPWADGTPCAKNKWCQQGECVQIRRITSHPIDGQWGPWSDYGQCARSCGGGIQRSFRECDHPRPSHGGKYCIGQRIRYRSCNTHECPLGTDFREEQCAAYNGQTFNINGLPPDVKWTPHYSGILRSDSCKLYCTAEGTGAYYLLKQKVIDGTPCALDSYDICVNGKCMSAGCDHILGSNVRPDNCGMCGGDNTTCKDISGHLHNVRYGYNSVVIVPKGATNLDVRQYGLSSGDDNYLALRADDDHYILNGDYVVSMFKKTIQYSGVTIEYTGSNNVMERINSSKPLPKPLYVEVLSVGNLSSPEVRFHYAISVERDKFEWQMSDKWSNCNRLCMGEQSLIAHCIVANTTNVVNATYCRSQSRPYRQVHVCNLHCQLKWVIIKEWKCSSSCGIGTKKRLVRCVQEFNSLDLQQRELHDQHCQHIGPKPEEYISCNGTCHGFKWISSDWSECSHSCGDGIQTRTVTCHRHNREGWTDPQPAKKRKKINTRKKWCNESLRPISKRVCNYGDCRRGAVWRPNHWQPCSTSCGTGKQRRRVPCYSLEGKKLPRTHCETKLRPQRRRKCNLRTCAPISCYDIHHRGNVIRDGEYDIYIRGRMIQIYCHNMAFGRPFEFLTLRSGPTENYSEIYNKRPTKADACPDRGRKCENCVIDDARIGGGLTQFTRIRINITSLLVFSEDFTFSETLHGWQIAYGESGDCYSMIECPQGMFKMNLSGTGLSVSSRTRWMLQGNNANKQIERINNGEIVIGRCGGYCGRCKPANGLYLDLSS